MVTFTPGPWLIHAIHRWIVPAEDAFKEPADALPICQLRDPDMRLTEDETLANGFLIAAAPELYDALEVIASCGAVDVSNTAIIVGNNANVVLQQAWAALRKARGESS